MLQFDKKFLEECESSGVKKIKVFFYEAGCSGTKVDIIIDDFEITDDLQELPPIFTAGKFSPLAGGGKRGSIQVYVPKSDAPYLQNGRITRTIKADHTGQEKTRYIFTSEEIKERCGCGTSFSFEKKAPKFDVEKLKDLKFNFKK